MATRIATHQYRCYNDCEMSGCPGHTATLELQTTSDAYTFDDGISNTYHFNPAILNVLYTLVREVEGK